MREMSQSHDLYGEASDRRHREVEALVRSRSHQRAARSASCQALPASTRRVRVIAVVAPAVALVVALASGVA